MVVISQSWPCLLEAKADKNLLFPSCIERRTFLKIPSELWNIDYVCINFIFVESISNVACKLEKRICALNFLSHIVIARLNPRVVVDWDIISNMSFKILKPFWGCKVFLHNWLLFYGRYTFLIVLRDLWLYLKWIFAYFYNN